MMEVIMTVGVITVGVALGLTVFQWVIMPIGEFFNKVKETVDERESRRGR